jgi:hypothetical protein
MTIENLQYFKEKIRSGKPLTNRELLFLVTSLDTAEDNIVTNTSDLVTLNARTLGINVASVNITNAQLLAIRATPIEIVPVCAAGSINELIAATAFFDYTAAYTESTDNLVFRYENTTGTILATIETTGFLDATADTYTRPTFAAVANLAKTTSDAKAIVLHNSGDGEFGGGNAANVLRIRALYKVTPIGW